MSQRNCASLFKKTNEQTKNNLSLLNRKQDNRFQRQETNDQLQVKKKIQVVGKRFFGAY